MSEFFPDGLDDDDDQTLEKSKFIVRYAPHGILQSSVINGTNDFTDFEEKVWEKYHHKGFLHIEFDPNTETARIVPNISNKSKL